MSPPQFKECTCGHMGSVHRDDGTCTRCECEHFKRPSRTYTVESTGPIRQKTGRRRHHGVRGE